MNPRLTIRTLTDGGQSAASVAGWIAEFVDGAQATLDLAQFAPTVNLNVQFHRPARVGALKGLGRVLMRGRETCHGSAELWQNDKIVATATGTFVIRKI